MPTRSVLHGILTPSVLGRIALGWGAVLALLALSPVLSGSLPSAALWPLLGAIVVIISVCAFGVVGQAEHLARRLGDPYGTLVLTLSIVLVEVILISAVLLGPGRHPSIARDSVMAVSMIILNLVVGAALLLGARGRREARANRSGVSVYLALLVVLLAAAFAFPALIGVRGAYTPVQAVVVVALTVVLYAYFLVRQTGPDRAMFQEVSARGVRSPAQEPILRILSAHRVEVVARIVVLVVTVVPVVLLAHEMAALLDDGLARIGAPAALSGILIAAIVFLPETITTLRAAFTGEMQRVSNLCHGALVSTVGLTIPAVLVIGMLTGQTVLLAADAASLALLALSLLLTLATFSGRRLSPAHGAAHLMLFVLWVLTVFA